MLHNFQIEGLKGQQLILGYLKMQIVYMISTLLQSYFS
jgi:hypothetical protein